MAPVNWLVPMRFKMVVIRYHPMYGCDRFDVEPKPHTPATIGTHAEQTSLSFFLSSTPGPIYIHTYVCESM